MIHDWIIFNGWAADFARRSEHARKAIQTRWDRERGKGERAPRTNGDNGAARSLADARFKVFWDVYPKKVDKQDALDAWRRIDPTLYDEIIADARKRWITYGKDDRQFIPGPAKYLRKEKWTDEVIPRSGDNGRAKSEPPVRKVQSHAEMLRARSIT